MAVLIVVFTLSCLSIWSAQGQQTLPLIPAIITGSEYAVKITTNSAILQAPKCYFKNTTCSFGSCSIYMVPATSSIGVSKFDQDKTSTTIVSSSPYTTAFSNQASKNYFLTRVGSLEEYTCDATEPPEYFRVGSESDTECSNPNCNGLLPSGSNVSFKYILINSTQQSTKVLQETRWSRSVKLISPTVFASIDEGLPGRSPSMIAITVILSVALFVLLVLLIVFAVQSSYEPDPMPVLGSLRQYDTHQRHHHTPHANPAFDGRFGAGLEDDLGAQRRHKNPEYSENL